MMQRTKEIQQSPDIRIAVENFGPIEKAEIDLRPLTVFVGESNTGKTYLSALIRSETTQKAPVTSAFWWEIM
ncbi:MAG: AAA family ATPase [Candidatus Poribacteria bacterium]|nr:AAA family ATPase [Candidatus Poribacteria bacterium]